MTSIYSILNYSIQKSSDVTTWTSLFTGSIFYLSNFLVVSENLMFITQPDNNFVYSELYKSTDNGQNWTKINFSNITSVYDIKYNGNYILVAGNEGRVAKSLDGISWTEYIVDSSKNIADITDIGWNGTNWMCMLYDVDNILYSSISSDGETWSSPSTVGTEIVKAPTYIAFYKGNIVYYNGNWVYVAGDVSDTIRGKLQKSSNDGNTWSEITITSRVISYIAFNNSFLLIGAPSGYVYKTSDLINFSTEDYSLVFNGNAGVGLKQINFFNNNFYIFGNNLANSIVYTSNTGDNFSLIYTFNSQSIWNTSIYTEPTVPCLVKGMEVNVEEGIKKVEDLKVGDSIVDILGRKIKISEVLHKKVIGNEINIPYIIPKDFFEKDIPSKDIHISYNHAYFYNGKWTLPIRNKNLKRDKSYLGKEIEYYHVSLPNYAVDKLVCYNLPVDSFDNSKYNKDNMI